MRVGDADCTDCDGARRDPASPTTTTRGRDAATWTLSAFDTRTRNAPMDLDFTPEQELLRETVRGRVRSATAASTSCARWRTTRVGYPDDVLDPARRPRPARAHAPRAVRRHRHVDARRGRSSTQEFGRALAPSPHFVSSVMSGGVLAVAGSDEQKAEWLPRIASGEAIVTPAWLEPDRGFGPQGRRARGRRPTATDGS